ncbi:hypothetical protein PSHT_13735 [Puccinia striiformis]|uniref:Integrase catalytic domain-containing protein n=1 Tax=Puccinia striiformis TaxID=27350 RepID=A0A2S4UPM7_9BASI|nr:hypothetical protein PSHT_13735 [Puccinia striiformis]
MSLGAGALDSLLPFPTTEHADTTAMAQSSNNDGFRQAMLKTALETTPQLSEENYSIWSDKMTALLELRGVLTTLESNEPDSPPLAAETNAELKLLLISKMDSLTHSNIVTTDNRSSARLLWRAIKDRFASNESSNRARVFNEFLYVRYREDALEAFVTDIKVAIKKLVDVGIDLPQDILAYLILFKLPESLQLLKRQIMHSDKTLNVQFVCNHLTQFNNENRAETKESSATNQAALVSTRNQKSNRTNENRNGQPGSGQSGGSKRCTTGYHNPKLDQNHSADSCWHLHPDKAPDWWKEAQAKWQASKNVNYYTSLITLWTENVNPKSRIVLDSGASAHIFNDTKFFSQLELGGSDVIRTGKKDATLPVKGTGRVTLQWGNSIVSLDNCLFVPDIVINLISAGALLKKGCQIVATRDSFTTSKEDLNLFKGLIDNNLFSVDTPDATGGFINNVANVSTSTMETLKAIHEKYGHASLQRIDSLIPSTISRAERDSFECKACILSKITKQSFNSDSTPASKVFKRIHLDIIGPITPESKIKSRFILTLVDNFSGYLAGFPLVKKDDTTEVLIKVIETEKKRLGYFPSLICSDGGGEVMGSRLVSYLEENHIQRLISEPYHPEHNGRAERASRTIVESMRATFRGSGIPKAYWHEVVKSCCLSLNQIPRKGSTQSPWEIVHRKSLPPHYLKPLGTSAIVLNMNRVKGKKFDVKGQEGLLVGFNVLLQSYRIITQTGAIIDSKHVRFLKYPQMDVKFSDPDDFYPDQTPPAEETRSQPDNSHPPEDEHSTCQESSGQEGIDHNQEVDCNDSHNSDEDIAQMLEPAEPVQPSEVNTRVLRDRTTIKPPMRFGFHHYYEPNTFESAIRCADEKFWKAAISTEISTIEGYEVWDNHYGEPPNPLDTTWVFKIKDNCHGDPLKHKARLCVQGFEQIEGVDHGATFAPTGKVSTLRMLFIYSLHQNLVITQFDVQGAFLHAPLSEDVFIKTPKGVNRKAPYLKLKKALYGLKQAPKNWYETLTSWLESIGFHESNCDPCLYLCDDKISRIFFHVDDLILIGPGNNFKEKFETRFTNSSCHEPNTILGMKFERVGNKILLSQPKHIEHGLEELGLQNCRPSTTPLTPNLKLKEASDEDHASFKKENINYRSAIGLMNYIAGYTRPDISFAVSSLARFSVKPGMTHWNEVKKVWQYLRHTKDMKLTLEILKSDQLLEIYSDATWGDDPIHRTSQSGYLCYLFGALVSWNSCRQHNVTYSSTEAELNPLVDAATHYIDDKELNERLMMDNEEFLEKYANSHYIDNKGLDDKLKKFGSNPKTRHIDLKTKGIRQELKHKNIKIILIRTFDMIADALTKAASKSSIENLTKTIDPAFSNLSCKSLQPRGV